MTGYAEKVNFILDRSANDKFIIYNRDGRIFEKALPYQNIRSIALKRDNLEGGFSFEVPWKDADTDAEEKRNELQRAYLDAEGRLVVEIGPREW